MSAIKLEPHQITRRGNYPAPNVPGCNSLFFHHLTSGNDTNTLYGWGNELTSICERNGIDYYYFINDRGIKINVYPNDTIESWWNSK